MVCSRMGLPLPPERSPWSSPSSSYRNNQVTLTAAERGSRLKPRRTTTGVFVCQGDETLSRPHETLDFIVAASILVIEYFQLMDGNWFGGGSGHTKICVS